jgi:dTDP-4-amino-4,6-dideoxygalactose transaminase
MKKEIGSIYPLSNEIISEAEVMQVSFHGENKYYSLCREALFDIAKHMHADENDTVLIPAYTCQTVVTPFEEVGWKCVFYSIQRDLRINISSLEELVKRYHPRAVVIHPFYGMELDTQEEKALKRIGENGIRVILDLTQCIFSTKRYPFVSFVVGSYRKWFPIPDGGFLECNSFTEPIVQPEKENVEFTERNVAAMYLRGQYFGNGEQKTKDISIWLNKSANHLAASNIAPHRMSDISYNLLQKENLKDNQNSRFNNYAFLFQNIRESTQIKKVCQNLDEVTTAPLYFTIYVQDRPALQRVLAQEAIYAPVIWPVEDERVLVDNDVKYIYDHLLAIPCDQRYGTVDMQRIVTIINNY